MPLLKILNRSFEKSSVADVTIRFAKSVTPKLEPCHTQILKAALPKGDVGTTTVKE